MDVGYAVGSTRPEGCRAGKQAFASMLGEKKCRVECHGEPNGAELLGPHPPMLVSNASVLPSQVGSQSTLHSTQCLCNHLTFFGCVALVLPHLIDLHNTAKLLSTVGQNPSGLALLSSLLLGYGAALVWARWRQRTDVKKVRGKGKQNIYDGGLGLLAFAGQRHPPPICPHSGPSCLMC